MKVIVTGMFVVLLVLLSFAMPVIAQNKTIQVGDTFPGFYLKDMDGSSFFLADHVGEKAKVEHKAVIISLAASYCKPCKKEIPEFAHMIEKYGDKGLAIFIVAVENAEQAKKLVAETKTTLPVLVDRYLIVPKRIGRDGIPCTLLLDPSGTVKFINTGFNEKNADEFIKKFETEVAALLNADS